MEHMLKGLRVHTKRIYVGRKRAQNRARFDFERVYALRRTEKRLV